MESIIKKAIEGGYNKINPNNTTFNKGYFISGRCAVWKNDFNEQYILDLNFIFLDPLFWQALGNGCNWGQKHTKFTDKLWLSFDEGVRILAEGDAVKFNHRRFHEINLTEGWQAAINYLTEITK